MRLNAPQKEVIEVDEKSKMVFNLDQLSRILDYLAKETFFNLQEKFEFK